MFNLYRLWLTLLHLESDIHGVILLKTASSPSMKVVSGGDLAGGLGFK